MDEPTRTHVLVVGGGFAGVACAKLLGGEERVRVTLITAELAGRDIMFDHTEVFRGQPSLDLVQAEVVSTDVDERTVTLGDGRVSRSPSTSSARPAERSPSSA
ncbi:MAG TPA: hypothetical protein VFC00_39565 [Micromonosporaceae bacterium]|nr:hypothetical protein [Micromonosporaceae bacterium]